MKKVIVEKLDVDEGDFVTIATDADDIEEWPVLLETSLAWEGTNELWLSLKSAKQVRKALKKAIKQVERKIARREKSRLPDGVPGLTDGPATLTYRPLGNVIQVGVVEVEGA